MQNAKFIPESTHNLMHFGPVKYVSTTPTEMAFEAVVNPAASFHINLWNVACLYATVWPTISFSVCIMRY